MKRRLILQLLFLLLLLFIWNVGHYAYQWQKNSYYHSLESLPLIIFCSDFELTEMLVAELEAKEYVAVVEIDDNQKIAEVFLEEYGLEEAEEVIRIHALPNVLRIYFNGKHFRIPQKIDLRDFLLANQNHISWQYNDAYWTHFNNRLKLVADAYFYINILIALIIFVFAGYFRIRSERKQDSFWEIYQEAGGSRKKRELIFWVHSLLLVLIPVGINIGVYYYVQAQDLLAYPIALSYFGYQIGLLLLISLFSRLLLWKRL